MKNCKCAYCGDKHKETEKHLVKIRNNDGSYYQVWVCHTCGRLRSLL